MRWFDNIFDGDKTLDNSIQPFTDPIDDELLKINLKIIQLFSKVITCVKQPLHSHFCILLKY